MEEKFKVTSAREVAQCRNSSVPLTAYARIKVTTGREWRAQEAVQDVEARLSHRWVIRVIIWGHTRLGSSNTDYQRGGEALPGSGGGQGGGGGDQILQGGGNEPAWSSDEVGKWD